MADLAQVNSIQTDGGGSVYESAIFAALDEYIAIHNGVDICSDVGQYQFKDCLYFIHDLCFMNNQMIRVDDNNKYNMSDVLEVYEIYKRLCARCNKIITLADFSILTGIEKATIYGWKDSNKFNAAGSEINQKIYADQEDSIASTMISTGRNPVGFVAWLNHYHGWATQAAAQGREDSRRSPEEIAAAHGVAVESQTVEALPQAGFTQDVVPSGEG